MIRGLYTRSDHNEKSLPSLCKPFLSTRQLLLLPIDQQRLMLERFFGQLLPVLRKNPLHQYVNVPVLVLR